MTSRDMTTICLFDIDGTLTGARKKIRPEMEECLKKLKSKVVIGLVGGSDAVKITEQMGGDLSIIKEFDYFFCENGLVAYKNGEQIGEQSLSKYMDEDKLQEVINFSLNYMSNLKLPCKRGTFVEFRKGMLNLCPVGRSCSQAERDEFGKYDEEHKIRQKFVDALYEKFSTFGLCYVIGGQISIDVIPKGWDKTFCLQFVEKDKFKTIHFFGDKTQKGGNDYEIYEDSRTIGHSVKSPEDTMKLIEELFF